MFFEWDSQKWYVNVSYHCKQKRHNQHMRRDWFMTKDKYKDIIKKALINGLTSFRNKTVVISWFDDRKAWYSLMVELENNTISIITTLRTNDNSFDVIPFVNIRHRINLFNENYKYKTHKEISKLEKNNKSVVKSFKKSKNINSHMKKQNELSNRKREQHLEYTYEEEIFQQIMKSVKRI